MPRRLVKGCIVFLREIFNFTPIARREVFDREGEGNIGQDYKILFREGKGVFGVHDPR